MKPTAISSALETIKAAQTDLQTQITQAEAIELGIAKQISALRAMPISLTDFSQYLKKHIEVLGDAWFTGRSPNYMTIARTGTIAMNLKIWESYEPEVGVIESHELFMPDFCKLNHGDAFGALCFTVPDTVHEKLMAGYRAAVGDKWGNEEAPTVESRRATIAELQGKLADSVKQRREIQASLGELLGVVGGTGQGNEIRRSGVDSVPTAGTAKPVALKGQRLSNPDLVE